MCICVYIYILIHKYIYIYLHIIKYHHKTKHCSPVDKQFSSAPRAAGDHLQGHPGNFAMPAAP